MFGAKLFKAPSRADICAAMQESAFANQIHSMRHPKMELHSLTSSWDFDEIAAEAVEGRNKQLEFYRKRSTGRV